MKETLIIFKKELSEIFRDKLSILIFLVPLMIFPVFNFGMEYLNKNTETDINICIDCDSQEAYSIINQFIEKNYMFNFELINSNSPEILLKSGDIDCYINASEKSIDFIYNSSSFDSLSLTTKLGENFQQFYNSLLSESYKNIFQLNLKNENGDISNSFDAISTIFVPIVLVMLIFQGTSSFANDLFAGEKERKTLELLLLSGVKKQAVFCGKSLALIVLSFFYLSISIGSCFISFFFSEAGLSQFKFMKNENYILNIFYIIILLLTLSFISVYLSITVSMLSKNMKNSQISNEIILAVPVCIMALLTLGIIGENVQFFNYLPILNLLTNLNNAFAGNNNIINMFVALVSNIVLILFLIVGNVQYMKTEKFIS